MVSLSPEQFFTIRGGVIEARPMKGTAPRRADPAPTRRSRALAADEKQRAENLMIVDLMRNDLARVSQTGSVEVPDLFAVETYPTVHQMVSRITARLRAGVDAVDVLRTIFPCGSVTGAPKIAAIEALRARARAARRLHRVDGVDRAGRTGRCRVQCPDPDARMAGARRSRGLASDRGLSSTACHAMNGPSAC